MERDIQVNPCTEGIRLAGGKSIATSHGPRKLAFWTAFCYSYATPTNMLVPTMAFDPITSRESLIRELEQGWALFDSIYNTFGPADWDRKFGRTWTYADQPFHMAYFDRMIAKALREGPNSPPDRMHLRSMGDLTDWNRREFARRPAGQSVQQSLD